MKEKKQLIHYKKSAFEPYSEAFYIFPPETRAAALQGLLLGAERVEIEESIKQNNTPTENDWYYGYDVYVKFRGEISFQKIPSCQATPRTAI